MKVPHCSCCLSHLLASALLLLLLLPGLGGPLTLLLQAAEAAPDPGPPDRGPRTRPPLPPGPTVAQFLGGAPAEAAGPRGAEGGNGSSPRAGLSAEDSGGKAGEEDSVGGSLAVSPNPGDKPMTQRALTVLMVVSGAVLVYFVVRTVRMRRRNRKTRRYGVLDTNIENMELTPLEQDDEDDDNTLFDANHPRR
ncbi:membrane protein FAM174A isoform X2 [Mirounga angustirostris]|uniref:Transmembrane protein 157 n=2 Tax=Phocidae TaxID=9709 RepID=A0A2Y9HSV9_NEOSC|nr:membrane protein FAM174A isoform X1 [Neomonachus schauinslandi]XP_021554846.1 membrane protein FAM174A isoform X2 [Neomonachus schauinslandi]XP_034870847.1 membrane protein FAM174A isoform X1 [Mirounga leonina]XP_034870848.1 membrane protein FAM174A isoform X2 [Mirounga leonina]XP_035954625.1 membrane protein FAM174A isoform X2 [Halichoerus grypus]XP_035954626.1 membrane protein FAM174A isoform X3 [Halichoerus grypus]XP_045755194.1 membrane protein FAM174A isoform X1 [Mirounga angustirostr